MNDAKTFSADINVNLVNTTFNEISVPSLRTVIFSHLAGGVVYLFDEASRFDTRSVFLSGGESISIYTHVEQRIRFFCVVPTLIRMRVC